MTKLTLPIEIGKKYVRRDGKLDSVVSSSPSLFKTELGAQGYVNSGRMTRLDDTLYDEDLVSDYIEPAKGHPHAEKMAEFAQDARETEKPWERWEFFSPDLQRWVGMNCPPRWGAQDNFRRKPTITSDPHAASMLLYAQDAAETDRAWERWEERDEGDDCWQSLIWHPLWSHDRQYQRKAQS